ncbi:hypothetical protein N7G274_004526 [Stereocaulon virgatum]|uniref:Ankyrin n=1 Tax=Stereocaulon virgatum TaxID=373712 RepID=A0ABR4ADX4_9LECA
MDLFDGDGYTALHMACSCAPDRSDREEIPFDEDVRLLIVKMLVEGGVNINAKNILGETALSMAIWNGSGCLASYLLYEGAWLEIRNDQQKLESRIAAMRTNREPTLPLQIAPGVDLHMQISIGSIFHIAVIKGQHFVVRKLIDRGVDVNTVDGDDWTAFEYAQDNDDKEMVQMLVEAGAVDRGPVEDEPQKDKSISDAPMIYLTAAPSPDGSNTLLSDESATGWKPWSGYGNAHESAQGGAW